MDREQILGELNLTTILTDSIYLKTRFYFSFGAHLG